VSKQTPKKPITMPAPEPDTEAIVIDDSDLRPLTSEEVKAFLAAHPELVDQKQAPAARGARMRRTRAGESKRGKKRA